MGGASDCRYSVAAGSLCLIATAGEAMTGGASGGGRMATAPPPGAGIYRTLPGHYYYDAAIFALEMERIFATRWICVGRADSIAAPGAFFLADVAGESIIVVRGRDNAVRAFYNACRHRGARLCSGGSGQLRSTIQCKYHAWTYALDGTLIGAPNMHDDADFDPQGFGLSPVNLELWEGLVFVSLAEHPTPLAEQGRYHHPRMARYHIGELKVGGTLIYDQRSNWKIVIANYEECAHCALVHPELSEKVPAFRLGKTSGGLDEGADFVEGAETLTSTGKTTRPILPHLIGPERHQYYGHELWPNLLVDMQPDYVVVTRLEPVAADRTLIISDILFHPDTMAMPDFDPSDAIEFTDLVSKQDAEVCELSQMGVGSRSFKSGGVYAPNERHIQNFDHYVLEALSGEPPPADTGVE
jgi:Rieske 2Fe-2S family protein